MNKPSSTLIAAVAALALSGGAYAQAGGGSGGGDWSTHGSTPGQTMNQMNDATGGYGTPGAPNSESGMGAGSQTSPQQNSTINSSTFGTSAPKSNNTLATPSTVSPVGH